LFSIRVKFKLTGDWPFSKRTHSDAKPSTEHRQPRLAFILENEHSFALSAWRARQCSSYHSLGPQAHLYYIKCRDVFAGRDIFVRGDNSPTMADLRISSRTLPDRRYQIEFAKMLFLELSVQLRRLRQSIHKIHLTAHDQEKFSSKSSSPLILFEKKLIIAVRNCPARFGLSLR
jgi:hypothetical protein